MKIDITGKNPYEAVSDYVTKLIEDNDSYFDDYVVTIRTTNLGESNELLLLGEGGYDDWIWENDWYEGGDVEVLAVVPISDLDLKSSPHNLVKPKIPEIE